MFRLQQGSNMNKQDLLKQIAELAYNVGFGAKKHFATYDILEKLPGFIGFCSLAVGILGLVFDFLNSKGLSALFIILGITEFYFDRYNEIKDNFSQKGEDLTKLFHELKILYYDVKASSGDNLDKESDSLSDISHRYLANCLSRQILFSDWFAHYKFFWQNQIEWVDEQKKFKLWRDKIPLTFTLFAITLLLVALCVSIKLCKGINPVI